MVKRGKRIVSRILCATVLFTMTLVPGAVFAEENEALEAAGTDSTASVEPEAPDAAKEAAQTEQKKTAPAVQKEEAKAPAQKSQAAPQAQAAKSQAKGVDTQAARAYSVSISGAAESKCNKAVTLTATSTGFIAGTLRSYKWYYCETQNGNYKLETTDAPRYSTSTYSAEKSGFYYVVVSSGVHSATSNTMQITINGHDLEWRASGGHHWEGCKNCDYIIQSENHNLIKVEAQAPTCTEEGLEAYWICSTCKMTFIDDKGINVGSPSTIDKIAHKTKHIDAKAATCTEAGNNEYYTCETCRKVFKDEAGNTETTVEKETIAATGHNMTKTEAKAATCTEAGHDAYWTCETCNQHFADENGKDPLPEIIPTDPLGHELTLVEKVDATCLKDGHEEYWECKTCGKIFADEDCQRELDAPVVIPATGHKLGDWKVVKDPTVGEAGMKERVCEKCGYAETEAIPALDAAKTDLTSKTELNKTKSTAEDKSDDSAKTGDDMNVALYSLLALLAAAGAATTVCRRKTN